MRFRRLVAPVLLVCGLAAGVLSVAQPADAMGYGIVYGGGGGGMVRAQPSVTAAYYAFASDGYRLTMYCWVDGGWGDGNYWTNRWFQVAVPGWNDGGVGYINASLVTDQPSLPYC
jgi:hypothetical protein